jgi:hypothetical protein
LAEAEPSGTLPLPHEPLVQCIGDPPRLLLPDRLALLGVQLAHLALDLVQLHEELQFLLADHPARRALAELGLVAGALDATLPGAAWFQQTLAAIGYAVADSGVFDASTKRVIAVFHMKYRPSRYDGEPDAETAALMQVQVNPLQNPGGR